MGESGREWERVGEKAQKDGVQGDAETVPEVEPHKGLGGTR